VRGASRTHLEATVTMRQAVIDLIRREMAGAGAQSPTALAEQVAAAVQEQFEGVTFSLPIAKVDKATRTVTGIASPEVVDAHGQIVDAKQAPSSLRATSPRRRTSVEGRGGHRVLFGRRYGRGEQFDIGLPCAVGSGRRAGARSGWSFRAP
jgi:hypothetical protein